MRISDWSSDVCASDLHGSRSDDLRPHPGGGNGGWRLHAWLSSTPPQKAQGLPERRGWAAKSDQEARLQWPAAPSGRNAEKNPERSEVVDAGHDGPSRECRTRRPQRETYKNRTRPTARPHTTPHVRKELQ